MEGWGNTYLLFKLPWINTKWFPAATACWQPRSLPADQALPLLYSSAHPTSETPFLCCASLTLPWSLEKLWLFQYLLHPQQYPLWPRSAWFGVFFFPPLQLCPFRLAWVHWGWRSLRHTGPNHILSSVPMDHCIHETGCHIAMVWTPA